AGAPRLPYPALIPGSMAGIAASTSETCELGSPPKAVEAPENSFDLEVTWAWISMPMTTSQSPVAPLMSFLGSGCAVMGRPVPLGAGRDGGRPAFWVRRAER